ncbi:MAG TPA: glycine--tRNA ligase subunit beta [Candidatus Azoamicus sp. OHIO2]
MKNKKIYLLEILTEDLPTSNLISTLQTLNNLIINNFKKKHITIVEFKSFITIKRISFIFTVEIADNLDIRPLITNIFESAKFTTNMRWGSNKKSFIRPIKSYILMCNNDVLSHKLFGISSCNYTFNSNFLYSKRLNVTPLNYYKLLRYNNNIICDAIERLNIVKKKIHFYACKYNCNILFDDKILINVANSFEHPVINVINFKHLCFNLPFRIILLTLLSYDCIPLIQHLNTNFFLIVINSYKKKMLTHAYMLTLSNKLLDIEALYLLDKLLLNNINISKFRSAIFTNNNNLNNIYYKIKRLFSLLNYLSKLLYIESTYIRKCILLLQLELFSKFIFDNPKLTGLLFVDSYKKFEVIYILYEYNKIFNDYIPTNLNASVIIILENLDMIIFLFLTGNYPKGKNDPNNFKKKIIEIITCILYMKININLNHLIIQILKQFGSTKSFSSKIFSFFIDRLKFHFYCKYIDFIIYKENLYKAFELSISLNCFFKYKLKYDFFSLIRRIESITIKNKMSFLIKINKKLLNNTDEKILFNKIIKLINISNILIKNYMYFENIKFDLTVKKKIDKFFATVFVLCENSSVKNNRLKLLYIIKYLLNKVIKFNNKEIENIS